jgi:CarD family transcriptional regulator
LAPVEGADPEIPEAPQVAAETVDEVPALEAADEDAAPELDDADEADDADEDELDEAPETVTAAAPAPANDSLPPPLPRPQHSFGGGNRSPGGGVPGRMMPPPRPMAKAENFVEGDHVVYPTHGVGKVERIATEEIAGHKLELIHITFEENRMTLRVPVAKARTAGLRKLATRKLFDEALAVLKGRARIKRTMWSRRAQEYEAKINSGDPLSIAEVVRDLHRNAGQPDQSFSERQIYEAAMDRLAAELAALEQIDKMAAATKLVEFLKTV